jgi:DNA polymerase-3 subunit epsilon
MVTLSPGTAQGINAAALFTDTMSPVFSPPLRTQGSSGMIRRTQNLDQSSDKNCFVALDFETADHGRDSACAVGVVRVRGEEIVERNHWYIRPPRSRFVFTYLHGITWERVANKPSFGELWPELEMLLGGVAFVAAHNAAFDREVLRTCCAAARVQPPAMRFECTIQMARTVWNVRPTALPDVCRFLGIALNHHDALSDAEACARIVLAARRRLTTTATATAPSGGAR